MPMGSTNGPFGNGAVTSVNPTVDTDKDELT